MTVVSVKTGASRSDRKVTLEFKDGLSLSFSCDYLDETIFQAEEFCLWEKDSAFREAGRELNPGEEETLKFAAACYRAEKTALRLIARAEQNSSGLTAKLQRRGHDAAAARAVVSRFQDHELLDDLRYAELWLRSRLNTGKALTPRQLLAALGKRAIGRNTSRDALEKVLNPEAEYTLLLRYLDKTGFIDNKNTGNLRAHLKYEGFSSPVLDRCFDT